MAAPRADPPAAYRGRFAPSPSGPLHDGSLIAAMASYLDARAHGGQWLLRIEDIDTPRVVRGADDVIMRQLQALGMRWDEPPVWQSRRLALYEAAFEQLRARAAVYGCACTRRMLSGGPYAGTCRNGLPPGRAARAWRFRVPDGIERFTDRWQGPQSQDVAREVGDFILRRADGLWAYQFVVVVDDGLQAITDVVRGADLLDSTARQRVLARRLGFEPPRTLHVPLILDEQGRKLSKQNHAPALDLARPVRTLLRAWRRLGFDTLDVDSADAFWERAVPLWGERYARLAITRPPGQLARGD
ncbi:tRNA glutamyl-Q(34) synthetase GluQRS [Alcaligenaceae bacterium]|nr:tRNA glutamyl-Q(34) synthetase GluQRS [Alcaligenaceae bacterium]